ncbi:ubiquitin carboxylterminal hydrolase, putative [Entamoeba histolytica KU27]|nr:ubiquitin carboxylterminal hydrolase, putative [Entamoeba histolytica KU27]
MSKYVGRLFSPRDDHVKKFFSNYPICGIRNLGNTCFISSVLQSLANTQQIRSYCFHHYNPIKGRAGDKSVYHGSLLNAFINLTNAIWSGNYRFVTSLAIKDIVSETHPQYEGKDQNDAHEFLLIFLEMLENELNTKDINNFSSSISPLLLTPIPCRGTIKTYSHENSPSKIYYSPFEVEMNETESDDSSSDSYFSKNLISDVFKGRIKRVTECSMCHYSSDIFEEFISLSVPVPQWYSNEAHPISLESCIELFLHYENIDDWYCEKCNKKRKAKIYSTISDIPKVLIIQLVRIYSKKYPIQQVLFPLNDLVVQTSPNHFDFYDLYSFITHTGSLSKGHYISWNKVSNQWYCCNDENVSQGNPTTSSDTVYILFYKRKVNSAGYNK